MLGIKQMVIALSIEIDTNWNFLLLCFISFTQKVETPILIEDKVPIYKLGLFPTLFLKS